MTRPWLRGRTLWGIGMRMWIDMHRRRASLVGVTCIAVSIVGGCYNEGSPESARARVTNSCDVPIAVTVGSRAGSYPPDWDAALMRVVDPGEQVDLGEPLDYPPTAAWYVWVVAPGTEQMGTPHEVPASEAGEAFTSNGSRRVVIDVSGDMCPEP